MRVSVNDRPVATSSEDGATLEALLDSLRNRGEIARDQVIVRLDVNNHPWRAEDMDKLGDAPLKAVGEVAIATDGMQGYARRILTDARSMLTVLEDATRHLAAEFRADKPEQANGDLFNLLNALQRFLFCLYHVRNTCGLESDPAHEQQHLIAQLTGCLDLVELSQERRDWPSLADQLELDLLAALRGFDHVLDRMAAAL
ncbi:MAG: hypothetical protein AMK73_03425 [Planctomycetes bacterium SM23_32]|nr:MAG: hypothetical protein AMK73_03425 [Planctomycetes bacterium SM23_32]